MRAQRIVRHDRLGDEIGPLRLDAGIDVLAEIAVGPAVEATVLHRRHVIRDEIGTELVALVHHRPQRAGLRLEAEPVRIAQAACEDAPAPAGAVDLEDRGAVVLGLHAFLGDVAVGADAGIELRAVRTGDQALGPVMVDRPARQRRQHRARCGDPGIPFGVGISDDRIGIGDIEIVADQRDAERRVEMVEEDALRIRHAVAIAVTQQRDAVTRPGIVAAGGRPGLDESHDELLRPLDRSPFRGLGFHHQHVAVGQHVEETRMLQAGGEGLDLQALRHRRRLALLPADNARDVDWRQQILLDVWKLRVGTDLRLGIAAAVVAGGQKQQRGAQQRAGKRRCHRATPTPWR